MKFENPANGHIERTPIFAWLWTLLFGPIYFAIRGVWTHAVASFLLGGLTLGVSWLLYPLLAGGIIRRHYLRKGWIPLGRPSSRHMPPRETMPARDLARRDPVWRDDDDLPSVIVPARKPRATHHQRQNMVIETAFSVVFGTMFMLSAFGIAKYFGLLNTDALALLFVRLWQ